jgi:pre-mRNA-splicing factor 38A
MKPLFHLINSLLIKYFNEFIKAFDVIHMDEFIDILLREDRVFDVILPRISKCKVHEECGELGPRVSVLDDDLEVDMESDEEQNDVRL